MGNSAEEERLAKLVDVVEDARDEIEDWFVKCHDEGCKCNWCKMYHRLTDALQGD